MLHVNNFVAIAISLSSLQFLCNSQMHQLRVFVGSGTHRCTGGFNDFLSCAGAGGAAGAGASAFAITFLNVVVIVVLCTCIVVVIQH